MGTFYHQNYQCMYFYSKLLHFNDIRQSDIQQKIVGVLAENVIYQLN